jgi:hypothetical protein
MTTTQQTINTFIEQVDTNKEYTRAELSKILTQVYTDLKNEGKSVKKSSKKEDYQNQRIKREPTSYNLFIKENIPIVKEKFPDISRQDLMREVGRLWKDNKDISLSKKYNSPKNLDDEDERINIQSLVATRSSPKKTSSSIADEILSKSKLKLKSPPKTPPLPSPPKTTPLPSPPKTPSLPSPPKAPPLPPPPKRSSPKKSKSKLTKEELEIAKSKLKHIQKNIKPDDPNYYLEMAFRNLERKSPKRSSPKRSSPKISSPKRSSPKISSPKRSSPKISSPKKSKSRSPPKIKPDDPNYYLEMAFRNLEK